MSGALPVPTASPITEGHELVMRLAEASALHSAACTGLLRLLAEAQAPVADPAGALGLHPVGAERVLAVLAVSGLVERSDDGWWGSRLLRVANEGLVAGVDGACRAFAGAPSLLETGCVSEGFEGMVYSRRAVDGLARMAALAADHLAGLLGPAEGEILDLGAGSAVWSLAMASADPSARVVALDRASVLVAARARADALGLSERFDALPGDLGALPRASGRFARVVLANVLHLFDEPRVAAVLRWVADALRPGGELVIVDVFAPPGDRLREAYALNLRLRHATGVAHAPERLAAHSEAAGLRPSPPVLLSAHAGVLRATRP